MNGIEALIKKLTDECVAECKEKLREAEEKAIKIKEDYKSRGNAEAERIIAEAEKSAESDELRGAGSDALEASKQILSANHEIINKTFSRANELL